MTLLPLLLLAASQASTPRVEVPAMDHARIWAEEERRASRGLVPRYAIPQRVKGARLEGGVASDGQWSRQSDGRWRWALVVTAPGATSLDFGFGSVALPGGAELRVSSLTTGQVVSLNQSHVGTDQTLWTPYVAGSEAVIEVIVAPTHKARVSLALQQVNYGFRLGTQSAMPKALACNVDVACEVAQPYADQARAVARMQVGRTGAICSGSLINSTAANGDPLFLTAHHCLDGNPAEDAASATFYFRYEAPNCRGDAESGVPLELDSAIAVPGGATLLANYARSDVSLVRINQALPSEAEAFFSGWDRSGDPPQMGASIHHPRGDEKRISIEQDPIVDGSSPNVPGDFHWQVSEWDVGVTEAGSSGAPLLDENKRIVGQLSGGAFFECPGAEEGADYYGQFHQSWEGGGTPESRLKDWLDPIDTGAVALDGVEACDAPSVTVTASSANPQTGELVSFTTAVSGATPPYEFAWDVDGDGGVDATTSEVQVRYAEAPLSATLSVRDATGCQTNVSLPVEVSEALIVATAGAPVEECGDGDAVIEAGETWAWPVTLTNEGSRPASDVLAAFAFSRTAAGPKVISGQDQFGYQYADTASGACPLDFVDVSTTGTALTFTDTDDGGARVALGQAIDFYGQSHSELLMSSNGYLSTDPTDGGGDWSADCPLPQSPDNGSTSGGRLMPLHDDLVLDTGDGFHQSFATCPRASDTVAGEGCDVFQWENAGFFGGFGEPSLGEFDFQALLYHESDAIVYQYRNAPGQGQAPTIGIQAPGASDALTYACGTPEPVTGAQAVCFFHPASPLQFTEADARLLVPTVTVASLAPGESATVNVSVEIGEDFACGSLLGIDYLGAGYDGGYSDTRRQTLISARVGDAGQCVSASACTSILQPPLFTFTEGFWWNPLRSGNGIDLHLAQNGVLYGAWYTATEDREAKWYYLQTLDDSAYSGNQARASILEFSGPFEPSVFPPFQVVGEAVFTFTDPDRGLLAWTIDGQTGGVELQFFDLREGPPDLTITEQWYNPDESGWGFGWQAEGDVEFVAMYFYAPDGRPIWVTNTDAEGLASTGTSPMATGQVHCPGCAWLPPILTEVGTMSRSFTGPDSGRVDLQLNATAPLELQWIRNDFPIQPLGPNP